MSASSNTFDQQHALLHEQASTTCDHPVSQARAQMMFDAHHDKIWRFVRRLGLSRDEADDATQETFVIFVQKMAHIRPGSEIYYLRDTARKVAALFRRKKKRRDSVSNSTELALEVERRSTATETEHHDAASRVDAILETMPAKIRETFVLTEFEGMPRTDISKMLQVPEGTIASRLRKARELFEKACIRLQCELQRVTRENIP